MDVLPSDGLTLTNITATFDSVFINNVFPAGLRFPKVGYTNVVFDNVQFTDTAQTTVHGPIGNATDPMNSAIEFTDVWITMNRWAGSNLPLPKITGSDDTSVALNFTMTAQSEKVVSVEKSDITVLLVATPTTVKPGGSTTLTWSSTGASSCSPGDSLTGSVGTSGSRSVKVGAAGNYNYHVHCGNAADSTGATVLVVAAQ